MKANPTVETERSVGRTRRVRIAVGLSAGLLALTACTSDPGPKRVARDIIESEALADSGIDEECLLDELDKYSNDDLKSIADDLAADNSDRNAEGNAALAAFEISLSACR